MRYFSSKDKLGRQPSEHNNYDLLVRIFSTSYLLLWHVDRDRMCLDQRVLGRVRNTHFLHQACVDVTINDKEKKKQLQNTTIYGYHTALDELMGK